jgi:riboflavin kinase / FMN adenylyltransferase
LKVYHSVDEIPEIKNPVITLGTFDGVHQGHQEIIQLLKQSAERVEGETVLFTFHPHPRMVLHPNDHNLELIQTIEQRIKRLEEAGIQHLILHPFSLGFAKLSATEFVRNILVNKLNVKVLTIGYNHHFGKNREGNIELLRELSAVYNFEVQEIPAIRRGKLSISSTKIRQAIRDGDITTANAYLGASFCFTGSIKEGDKVGSKIGYPTANISDIAETQLLPALGVYVVKVKLNNKMYGGMMNIGYRPTVSKNGEQKIEVNIFDFNEDIYGMEIEVHVIAKMREEKSFSSLDELKNQLSKDETNSRRILDQFVVRG